MTDTRPTQLEVEAKAADMFGDGWKTPYEAEIRWAESRITTKLDAARKAVIETR